MGVLLRGRPTRLTFCHQQPVAPPRLPLLPPHACYVALLSRRHCPPRICLPSCLCAGQAARAATTVTTCGEGGGEDAAWAALENAVVVRGWYGTKMEAVVRRVMAILGADDSAKVGARAGAFRFAGDETIS